MGLKTKEEWIVYARSNKKPANIPISPYMVYRHCGYTTMSDWLGSSVRAPNSRGDRFRSFKEARAWVRKQNLKDTNEWKALTKSGHLPYDIPTDPNQSYEEFISMPDWLGSGGKANPRIRTDRNQQITREFKPARDFVRSLGLRGKEEWLEYVYSGQCPVDIPTCPDVCYEQWINFADWLGYDKPYAVGDRKKKEKI